MTALAACAVLTLVGSGCRPAAPSDTVASLSPAPTPTATLTTPIVPSPSAQPSAAGGWQRSPDQAALANALLRDVIWTGGRFLAIDDQGEVLLDSADGRLWHRQATMPGPRTSGPPEILAAGQGGVIAVGGGGDAPAGLWRSADGLTWSSFAVEKAFRARDHAFGGLTDVISVDRGWLAVGVEQYMNAPTPNLVRATVFSSPDGVDWTRVQDSPERAHGEMTSVVRTPSGYVAVGAVVADPSRGDSGLRAAVWTSPDGRAWSRVRTPPTFDIESLDAARGPTDVVLHGIAVHDGRMVALGEVTRYAAASDASVESLTVAWWSDGAGWTPVVIDKDVGAGRMTIAAVPGGFLATVDVGTGCNAGLWTSSDGRMWTCAGDDPVFSGFTATGAASAPGVELLVGYDSTDRDTVSSTTWTRTAP